MKKDSNFYVSTAIDYASGSPHIGHAYEKIGADVIARWKRKTNYKTFFLTGTDEHGLKIVENAKKKNLSPEEFVEIETKKFIDLTKKLNLSNDYFIRTTNLEHKNYIQKILQKIYDKGDIYLADYEGLYCVGCEVFYNKSDLLEDDKCPIHLTQVKKIKEKNYFFKLSKYQKNLLDLYKNNPSFISPKNRQKEIINRVEEGLNDISISRNKSSLSWGVEFPFDKDHVSYVWVDALFNYLSALQITEKKDFWPADIHIVGKDIMWFHMVYWPAFLLSIEEELPKKIFAHGMLLDENSHKMSKSLGNIVDPFEEIEKFGLDEFRYYILSLGSFGEDQSFSRKNFIEKINNDLNNDFGNLVSRVHTMLVKYFNSTIPKINTLTKEDEEQLENLLIYDKVNELLEELEFNKALDVIFTSIRNTNAYINKVSPWKIEDENRLGTVLNILTRSVLIYSNYLEIFMPEKINLLNKQFNFTFEFNFIDFNFDLLVGKKIGEKIILFTKIKEEISNKETQNKQNENKKTQIKQKEEFLGFSSLNLKVGEIISIKDHPGAEKLYIEQVDIGEEKPRQIISGIKDYFSKEDLLGKKVIVVVNLKPAKLRGEISQGMLLLVENKEENKLAFISSLAKNGTNLTIENEIANNSNLISIDTFFANQLISKDGKVLYKEKEVKAGDFILKVDDDLEGLIR